MTTPRDVLAFWFPEPRTDLSSLGENAVRWFQGGRDLDHAIARRFADEIARAARGELDAWKSEPRGRLALIVLLDQFTRNAFRGTTGAYNFDELAVRLCREGLAEGADLALTPIERHFFYLPLLHSERLADQDMSIRCTANLLAGTQCHERRYFLGWMVVARRQRETIRRFGRFPHRNAILGRTSTPGEVLFLTLNAARAAARRIIRRSLQRA